MRSDKMDFNRGLTDFQQKLVDFIIHKMDDQAKLLLQNVDNLNRLNDSSRSTLLHHSVRCGNATMAQHLIEMGCDVNAMDDCSYTPLMIAVQNTDATIVDILLKNNAYVFTELSTLQFALQCSMNSLLIPGRHRHQLILEMLFSKVNESYFAYKRTITKLLLRCSDFDKFTAVVFGNIELTEIILKSGYPVDFQEPARGCTALHCAIIFAKVENAKILIKYNANTYATNHIGLSPLRYYTWNFESVDKDSSVLRSFLTYNMDLYLPNSESGCAEVEYLLQYGHEKTKETVLEIGLNMVVSYIPRGNSEEKKNVAKIAVLLLQHGLDAQIVFTDGWTLIEYLGINENITSLHVILEYLALMMVQDESFLTERTRHTLKFLPSLTNTLNVFTQTFQKTKDVILHGKVTLFKLMTENIDKLVAYAHNKELISKFKIIVQDKSDTHWYYLNTLRKRAAYALERVEYEAKVASIIQELTGLCADAHRAIVYRIIGYLDLQDLNNLCRLERILNTMKW